MTAEGSFKGTLGRKVEISFLHQTLIQIVKFVYKKRINFE